MGDKNLELGRTSKESDSDKLSPLHTHIKLKNAVGADITNRDWAHFQPVCHPSISHKALDLSDAKWHTK